MVEEYSKALSSTVINQPAGHLEEHESLIDAVHRETLEETCHHFKASHLVGIYRSSSESGRTYIRFAFSGELGNLDPEAIRDPDILACHWLSSDEIFSHQAPRSELVSKCLRDYLDGVRYPLEIIQDQNLVQL